MTEKKVAIIISPNWRDYGKKYLAECLESIRKQDWAGESKVFLIDNETTEESFRFLQDTAERILINPPRLYTPRPSQEGNPPNPLYQGGFTVEIIREEKNEGFAKANNDAMRSALEQGFDYLILFNMDTIVAPDTVSQMVKVAEQTHPSAGSLRPSSGRAGQVGAVQARLMLHPEKDKVNSLGNATHFLGFGYTAGYKKPITNYELLPPKRDPAKAVAISNDIFYPSGAAVLFKAKMLEEIGLFNEEYWMYNEDQEIGWRAWLAGYSCVLAPEAVVYHKFEFSRSIKRFYWMDRNRILSMLICYHFLTILLILPAWLVMEIGLLAFAIKGGWFKEKIRVYGYFMRPANWRIIGSSRQKVQKLRKIKDREVARRLSGKISFQEFDGAALRLANLFFNAYWLIVKQIIFW